MTATHTAAWAASAPTAVPVDRAPGWSGCISERSTRRPLPEREHCLGDLAGRCIGDRSGGLLEDE